MRTILTINHDGGKSEMFTCTCQHCRGGKVERAYSYGHAVSKGWVFTKDPKYSPDGEQVAVCPQCAKQDKWKPTE